MNVRQLFLASLLVLLCFLPLACVVLEGQRITLFHDADADRLSLLIEYDGIFDSQVDVPASSLEELREFAARGDVMFLDWFGRVDFEGLREGAVRTEAQPKLGAFLRSLTSRTSRSLLGHYRDPRGRMGVAQLVVIEHVSEVVKQLNEAIREALLERAERGDPPPEPWRRTFQLAVEAARANHAWVRLEGHSLVVSSPIHPAEFARVRGSFLSGLFDEWRHMLQKSERKVEDLGPEALLTLLTSAPLAITYGEDSITLRLGIQERPLTLRCKLRDGYRGNLEDEVLKLVPRSVDRETSLAWLEGKEVQAPILPSWAPVESRVRAVLSVFERGNEERRRAARNWLESFAERWNEEDGFPAAPTGIAEESAWLHAWAAWYEKASRTL